MLPFHCPEDFVPGTVHQFYEVLPTAAFLHRLLDVVHQTELPALILPGGTVLPCGKFSAALLVGRQDAQIMFFADLVTDPAKLAQGVGILAELSSVNKADRVDHKVGMDMLGIAVGGYLHLISGPRFLCKRSCNLMRLLGRDILPRMEGLNILIEVDPIRFVVGSFRCQELCDGITAIAVDTADQFLLRLLVPGFLFLGAVFHHSNHGTEVLLLFLDVGDCCHQPPCPIR